MIKFSEHEDALLERRPDDGWDIAEPYPLSAGERRILQALILALCPQVDEIDMDELGPKLEDHVLRLLRYMPAVSIVGFRGALMGLAAAPMWRWGRPTLIQNLSREEACELLEVMSESHIASIRLMVVAVRGLVLSTFFDQDVVHKHIGYAPVPFMRDRIQLRKKIKREAATAGTQVPMSGGAE